MIEYIDRQELIDAGRAIKLKDICPDWNVPIVAKALKQQGQAFLELIKKAPTEDVVEVVRCKDCVQFMQQYDIHNGRKLHYGICKLHSNKFHDEEVNCDHFCSYGKRKKE